MPALVYFQFASIMELRPDIASESCCLSERGEHIQDCKRPGDLQQLERGFSDPRASFLKQAQFDLADALFCIQHESFILFHLGSNKALCVYKRLFPDVVSRCSLCRAARDLNVIAKDLVVTDLK